MSNSNPQNKIIQKFMSNIFNKPDAFEKNKLFLKNHLRQDIEENNKAFCNEGLAFFSDRNYNRNFNSLPEDKFTEL
jgi:hypothetical protein